ncbi:permease [Sphaerisporangium album]|uniref:Permease n=2 Tax=Sphaerisporangium album TaxID=509200 RepID=A0A367EXL8_9ACTN|nr:permease [Sphaerisporangium album]
MGRSARERSPGNRLRFFSLILAAAMATLTATALLAVTAVYHGRDERNAHRNPRYTEGHEAVAMLLLQGDAVGDLTHEVSMLVPLDASAPPPPGIPRWPEPGEAFLSPELLRLGAGEQIKERYGRYAGLIAPEGLGSVNERYAYVRPPGVDPPRGNRWTKITGFGTGRPGALGEVLDVAPLSQFLMVLLVVAGGPAAVLVVVAARCGSAGRDRRNALLTALGGGWRHRAMFTVGEAVMPVAVGTAAGVLPLAALMIGDTRLPITGYLVGAEDMRSAAWAIPLAAVASFTLVLGAVLALHRADRSGRATRPRVFARPIPRWRLVVCGLGLLLVAASPYWTGLTRFFLYMAGSVLLWATVPSVAAVVIRRLGAGLARLGRLRGWAAALIAGRWITARPGVVVRLSVAIVIGLGLITQVQVWTSWLGSMGMDARIAQARLGDSVLFVRAATLTEQNVRWFTAALPSGYEVVALDPSRPPASRPEAEGLPPEALPQELRAPCPVLRRLGLTCSTSSTPMSGTTGDVRLDELERWAGNGKPLRVRSGPVATTGERPERLVVLADSGDRGQGAVKRAAYATLERPHVERPGQGWLMGANNTASYGDWTVLFATAGLAILLLAVMISSAAEFLIFGAELAPLAVQTDRRGVFVLLGLWNLSMPLVLVTVVGALVAVWQGQFFISLTQSGSFSWPILLSTATSAGSFAVLTGLLGGLSASRTAMRWRPRAD